MSDDFNRARAQLRAMHGVRLVRSHEEGTAAGDLTEGVYGFTGSPGLAAPLFATRRYRNFEIHRRDGDVFIVGFVSPRDAARLAQHESAQGGGEPVDLTLYPDAEGEAIHIVAIGYSAIARHRQYSIRNAAGLPLRVWPGATAIPGFAAQPEDGPQVAP